MASLFKLLSRQGNGAEHLEEFKQTGTDPNGQPVYAHVVALEPNSIGSGGGGVASSVTVADGTTSTQKLAVSAAGAASTDVVDRAGRLLGHVTVDNASIAVAQSGSWTSDVSDRVGRLLGHVTVDNASLAVTGPLTDTQLRASAVPVSGTFFQATQPVSIAAAVDVSDRAARLLGHVTVDNASLAVTGPLTDTQLRASAVTVDVNDRAARLLGHVTVDNATLAVTQSGTWNVGITTSPVPVSDNAGSLTVDGTITANAGTGNFSENIAQVAGVNVAAVPTGGTGVASVPVYFGFGKLTYDVAARNIATGALVAGTPKAVLSIEHGATATKTVQIRRIMIHAIQTTALSGSFDVQITKGTAASSAGTAVTPVPRRPGDAAAEAVVKSLPTITAATIADNIPAGGFATTTTLYSPPILVYDFQEGGDTKPLTLRAGNLDSIVINVVSTAAHNLTLTISLDFTEE